MLFSYSGVNKVNEGQKSDFRAPEDCPREKALRLRTEQRSER